MFVSVWLCLCHQISQKLLQGGGRGRRWGCRMEAGPGPSLSWDEATFHSNWGPEWRGRPGYTARLRGLHVQNCPGTCWRLAGEKHWQIPGLKAAWGSGAASSRLGAVGGTEGPEADFSLVGRGAFEESTPPE